MTVRRNVCRHGQWATQPAHGSALRANSLSGYACFQRNSLDSVRIMASSTHCVTTTFRVLRTHWMMCSYVLLPIRLWRQHQQTHDLMQTPKRRWTSERDADAQAFHMQREHCLLRAHPHSWTPDTSSVQFRHRRGARICNANVCVPHTPSDTLCVTHHARRRRRVLRCGQFSFRDHTQRPHPQKSDSIVSNLDCSE